MPNRTQMRPEAMTTRQLLAAARSDPDAVSFFGYGTGQHDSQEAIFIVKGKNNVQRVEDVLIGLGLMTTRPIFTKTPNAEFTERRQASGGMPGSAATEGKT